MPTRARAATVYHAAILLVAAILSCSDDPGPLPSSPSPPRFPPPFWVEAKADTIVVASEPIAIVAQDTTTNDRDIIRARLKALVQLDELGLSFGVTERWASCVSQVMRSEHFTELSLQAGETRELGLFDLMNPYHTFGVGPASAVATDVVRNGVRLGSPFAGQYTGTWTSDTQNGAAIAYFDVDGGFQLSVDGLYEGKIDTAGVYRHFSSICKLYVALRSGSPAGQPFVVSGREVTGTIIDSTFEENANQTFRSTSTRSFRLIR